VEFEKSIGTAAQIPESDLPEICFSGRSNVGKSSLINKLLGRKAMARVSTKPGKTVTINFFKLENLRLADLPGYGYAKVSGSERERWADLMETYFQSDRNIGLVFQLVDMRHSPSEYDLDMLRLLRDTECSFAVVLTKSDKLNKTERSKRLSELESSLSIIKLFATAAFIVLALLLIAGIIKNPSGGAVGLGALANEPFMPGGVKGLLGSMLIVVLAYSGFEVIGLAASETDNPTKTIPRVITLTVTILISIFILTAVALLPLTPTGGLSDKVSPMVAALGRWGMGWAGMAINFILVTAILSTMLASMFGLGRMMRSLADDGNAPGFLREHKDVPHRGILFSGFAMLLGMGLGLLFPSLYLFLISAGGFASMFTYASIMATHIRFRKCNGCPPEGKCQMPGYPYSSWIGLAALIVIIISMPLISGQTSGLIVGITFTLMYAAIYGIMKMLGKDQVSQNKKGLERPQYGLELSEELTQNKTEVIKRQIENDTSECSKNKDENSGSGINIQSGGHENEKK
jgi:ribosome biogenesis GTP-binding protein YsxC/EngB